MSPIMTKDEYKAAKAALGYTHKDLGQKIGISARQSLRYANGQSKVHKAVAMRLIEILWRHNAEKARNEAIRP